MYIFAYIQGLYIYNIYIYIYIIHRRDLSLLYISLFNKNFYVFYSTCGIEIISAGSSKF